MQPSSIQITSVCMPSVFPVHKRDCGIKISNTTVKQNRCNMHVCVCVHVCEKVCV